MVRNVVGSPHIEVAVLGFQNVVLNRFHGSGSTKTPLTTALFPPVRVISAVIRPLAVQVSQRPWVKESTV